MKITIGWSPHSVCIEGGTAAETQAVLQTLANVIETIRPDKEESGTMTIVGKPSMSSNPECSICGVAKNHHPFKPNPRPGTPPDKEAHVFTVNEAQLKKDAVS